MRLVGRLPGDNVGVVAGVILAIKGFRIDLSTTRTVYLDGETFALSATTLDAQGKPTSRELRVSVLKQVNQNGRITEREVSKAVLTTDKDTGRGALSLKVEDEQGGGYVVRVAGTDQFGNPIVADRGLEISGKADGTRLRLLTDRQSFKVGETASVNLHSRSKPGTALLAWEADRILQYKLVPIKEGENPVTWPVDGPQFPNFTLTASRMADDKFDVAALDIRVERDLRVTIKPLRPVVEPGQEVEVEVTTVDQLDRPVAAEVALALVDRSLLRLFNDRLPPIGPYFYDQTRTGAFSTEATNTFRDEPVTLPVSDAVVEEASGTSSPQLYCSDVKSRGGVMEEAKAMAKAEPRPNPSLSSTGTRGSVTRLIPRGIEKLSTRQPAAGQLEKSLLNGRPGWLPHPWARREWRAVGMMGEQLGRDQLRRKAGIAVFSDGVSNDDFDAKDALAERDYSLGVRRSAQLEEVAGTDPSRAGRNGRRRAVGRAVWAAWTRGKPRPRCLASSSPRRPTGTPASSPARTARRPSSSRPPWPCPSIVSRPRA